MSTIRVAKRRRWATVDRRSINDTTLSYRARGVLVWLLDKHDDGQPINATTIAKHGREGRDAIVAALKELEHTGYLVRRQYRADSGKWATESWLYEHPDLAADRPWETGTANQGGLTGAVSQGLTPRGTNPEHWDDPQTPSGAPPAADIGAERQPPLPTPESLRLALGQTTTTEGTPTNE